MPRFGLPVDVDDDEYAQMTCPDCRGKGKLFNEDDPDDRKLLEKTGRERVCPRCNGTGNVPRN